MKTQMAAVMKSFLAALVVVITGCGPAGSEEALGESQAAASSGMPNGAHFNLNIIGMENPKSQESCGSGHVIFVPLSGTTKIMLSEGDFSVVDCNGTDGPAAFQLPSPDPDNDGTTTYSVWARALGKPGGSSTTTTCATDAATGELYCSLFSAVLVRNTGKSSFTNVSRELLFVYADIDADGDVDRVPLFDSRLQDYFWNYQNAGLRLAQLRFYEVPTTVP
ncbi:MAG: hypothetical protein HY901_21610 [Deltaproteobacteria bacterium]|nr:hypothetical protein [Deltaproteobacteria bacterium]